MGETYLKVKGIQNYLFRGLEIALGSMELTGSRFAEKRDLYCSTKSRFEKTTHPILR